MHNVAVRMSATEAYVENPDFRFFADSVHRSLTRSDATHDPSGGLTAVGCLSERDCLERMWSIWETLIDSAVCAMLATESTDLGVLASAAVGAFMHWEGK